MQKAMVYWQFTLKRTSNPEEFNLLRVLFQMVKSGKFYPSSSFVCAQTGKLNDNGVLHVKLLSFWSNQAQAKECLGGELQRAGGQPYFQKASLKTISLKFFSHHQTSQRTAGPVILRQWVVTMTMLDLTNTTLTTEYLLPLLGSKLWISVHLSSNPHLISHSQPGMRFKATRTNSWSVPKKGKNLQFVVDLKEKVVC